jgi:intraflagellar transport protein 52
MYATYSSKCSYPCACVSVDPLNRPISAFYKKSGSQGGRMIVIGSSAIFDDSWLEEEENAKLQDVFFKWLLDDFSLDAIDAESWDLFDYHYLPNTEQLAERLRSCLQVR